jgi:HSP20 family protein
MKIRIGASKDLDRLSRQMSDFVERVLREKSTLMNAFDGTWRPSIDIFETEDRIIVIVDLAGVSREEMKIEHEGDLLRIAGRRRDPQDLHQHDLKKCHQMEIDYGPFERLVRISIPIDRDAIEAKYEGGFLKVLLPKKESGLAQTIEIL